MNLKSQFCLYLETEGVLFNVVIGININFNWELTETARMLRTL